MAARLAEGVVDCREPSVVETPAGAVEGCVMPGGAAESGGLGSGTCGTNLTGWQ